MPSIDFHLKCDFVRPVQPFISFIAGCSSCMVASGSAGAAPVGWRMANSCAGMLPRAWVAASPSPSTAPLNKQETKSGLDLAGGVKMDLNASTPLANHSHVALTAVGVSWSFTTVHVDDSEVPWLVVWLRERERFSKNQRARLIRQAFLHPGAAPCKSAAPLIESRVGLEMQP